MASPKWYVVYAFQRNAWQHMGQGWQGQGGENLAPAVSTQTRAPVYIQTWDPDVKSWSGGMFDAAAAARAATEAAQTAQAAQQAAHHTVQLHLAQSPAGSQPTTSWAGRLQNTVQGILASLPTPAPGGFLGGLLREVLVSNLHSLYQSPTADSLQTVITRLSQSSSGAEANAVADQLRPMLSAAA